MKNTIMWILFLALLVFVGSSDAAQRRSLADCSGDWNNPDTDDVCYDLTLEQWLQYDGSTWRPVRGKRYATASLPATCIQNQLAILTDGDAAGNVVICDGSNVWRARAELDNGIINPAFPPYNCTKAGSNNATCLQAVLDELELNVGAGITIRKKVYFPHRYTTTSGLTFDVGSDTSALVEMYSQGRSGGIACNFTGTTPCITFTTTGSALNTFVFRDMQFIGVTNIPDILVKFAKAAQVEWHNTFIGDFNQYGVQVAGSLIHGHFIDSVCNPLNDMTGTDPACLQFGTNTSQLLIQGWSIEIASSSAPDLAFVYLSGATSKNIVIQGNAASGNSVLARLVYMNTSAFQGVTIANNTVTGLVDYGLEISGFTTSLTNLIVTGNSFARASLGGSACMLLERVTDGLVSGNTCDNWADGIQLGRVITGVDVVNNQINDGTACLTAGVSSGTVTDSGFDGNICYNTSTTGVTWGGTSGGGNYISNTKFPSGAPTTPYSLASFGASDRLTFAPLVQAETCADSGDANPGALAITPYYSLVDITTADTNGCTGTMGEYANANGAKVTLRLVVDGGDISFADSPGVLEIPADATVTLDGVGDNMTLQYIGGAVDAWYEHGTPQVGY